MWKPREGSDGNSATTVPSAATPAARAPSSNGPVGEVWQRMLVVLAGRGPHPGGHDLPGSTHRRSTAVCPLWTVQCRRPRRPVRSARGPTRPPRRQRQSPHRVSQVVAAGTEPIKRQSPIQSAADPSHHCRSVGARGLHQRLRQRIEFSGDGHQGDHRALRGAGPIPLRRARIRPRRCGGRRPDGSSRPAAARSTTRRGPARPTGPGGSTSSLVWARWLRWRPTHTRRSTGEAATVRAARTTGATTSAALDRSQPSGGIGILRDQASLISLCMLRWTSAFPMPIAAATGHSIRLNAAAAVSPP